MHEATIVFLHLYLAAAAALPAPAPKDGVQGARPDTTAAVAIWSSVIATVYPDGGGVVLADSTIDLARAPRRMDRWLPSQRGGDSAAVLDMLTRNRHVAAVDSVARHRIQRSGSEPRHVRLALPGFDASGDIAFVYGHFTCGAGCGWDEGFVLERRGSTWTVVARRRYSVS